MNERDAQQIANAALLMARSACAMIEAMGMNAENQMRQAVGENPVYSWAHFQNVIKENQIGWNQAIELIRK